MITWVTVWILTVYTPRGDYGSYSYQLQYSSQNICEQQRLKYKNDFKVTRCDFQQIPVVVNK